MKRGKAIMQAHLHLTEREQRIIDLLLDGQQHSRNEITARCGPTNVSDTVEKMKRKTGLEVPCQRLPVLDRDGKTVQAGFWWLTEDDRQAIRGWKGSVKE